jgi:hypothetical protein
MKRHGQKTFEYTLNVDTIHNLIKALPPKVDNETLPNLSNYLAYKERSKAEKKEVREKSRTPNTDNPSEKSRTASEKSRTASEKSRPRYVKNQLNIDSITELHTDSQRGSVADETKTPTLAPVVAFSPTLSLSSEEEVTHNVDKLPTIETVTPVEAPASTSTQEKKTVRKPKPPKDIVSSEDQQRISAVFDCLDSLARETTEMPDFAYSRSKAASECVKVLLQARPVSPKDLRLVYMEMWNSPKGKDGFSWKENMSVRAICNQYDCKLLAARSKQTPDKAETPKMTIADLALVPFRSQTRH